MKFNDIQKLVFREYVQNGYFALFDLQEYPEKLFLRTIADITELGLILTKVTDAMECLKTKYDETLKFELADIIIHVMNFATRKGINLEKAILAKNFKNIRRPYLHGKDF